MYLFARIRNVAACTAVVALLAGSLNAEEAPPAGDTPVHENTYGGAGEPTMVSSVKADPAPQVGKTSKMVLSLATKDGAPVPVDQLEVVHMEPVHLLIVDPSLGDYHHIHPKHSTKTPGDYEFEFTPKRAGTYFVFADLHPKSTGIQEYVLTTLEVPGEAQAVEKRSNREFKTPEGYTFTLKLDKNEPMAGEGIAASVAVTGPDGKPFGGLEPVMGAFAHMVGFSENRDYVAHIHPLGPEIHDTTKRGGPQLDFHINIAKPGYYIVYNQVQIGGKDVFAPFGVEVKPRELPKDAAGLMKAVDAEMEKLANTINFGTLHRVHGLAFSVRDMVAEIPSRLPDLGTEAKAELDSHLQRVRSLAALLDKYGDSGDKEKTQSMLPRFEAEIAAVHKIAGTTPSRGGENVTVLGNTKCPVSGMGVGSMEPGAALVYKDIKVGLCCAGCTDAFMQDPEASLAKARESVSKQ